MPGFQALSTVLTLTVIPMIYKKRKTKSKTDESKKKESLSK